jgi:hypothetical protein
MEMKIAGLLWLRDNTNQWRFDAKTPRVKDEAQTSKTNHTKSA